MYVRKVQVASSQINGKGVFADEAIPKNAIVWVFKNGHDKTMAQAQFKTLSKNEQKAMHSTGYLSPWTGLWVFPPKNDPANYTNHSKTNNLSVVYKTEISSEPYFIANRDINKGEELTNNYLEFDEISKTLKPAWLA